MPNLSYSITTFSKILKDSESSIIEKNLDISAFFKLVFHKDFFLSNEAKFGMKKLFDEFVRDVHYEESQMKIRQRNQISFSKKTVSITSKYVFISCAVTEEDLFMELIKQVWYELVKFKFRFHTSYRQKNNHEKCAGMGLNGFISKKNKLKNII